MRSFETFAELQKPPAKCSRRALGEQSGKGGENDYGAIDDVRLSSTARYEKSFTPPKQLGPDEHTVFLLDFDGEEPFQDAGPRGLKVTTRGAPAARDERR